MSNDNVISIFGAGNPRAGSDEYEFARAVGRVLGEQGYALANGGYGGTMEASARGAKEVGGRVIGVTCDIWSSRPNEYLDEVMGTQSFPERLQTLIDLGRAGYVALPGGTGTLLELAWVWESACKKFLRPARPIVLAGAFWSPLPVMMASARDGSQQWVSLIRRVEELPAIFPARGRQDAN